MGRRQNKGESGFKAGVRPLAESSVCRTPRRTGAWEGDTLWVFFLVGGGSDAHWPAFPLLLSVCPDLSFPQTPHSAVNPRETGFKEGWTRSQLPGRSGRLGAPAWPVPPWGSAQSPAQPHAQPEASEARLVGLRG